VCRKHERTEKVTGAQDDDFLGVERLVWGVQKTRKVIAVFAFVCLTAFLAAAQSTAHSGPWELEDSGSSAGLRGIHAVGGGVVWASGTGGTVLRSEDTGYLWQQCAVPSGAAKLDFRGIWAWDAQNVFVLSSGPGGQSRLYETTDGCSSWKLIFTNPDAASGSKFPGFWDGILFIDRQHGLIYGDPALGSARTNPVEGGYFTFRLRVTHDGGMKWIPAVDPETDSPGKDLQPLPGESLFAASNSAMAAKEGWIWLGTSRARVLRIRQGSFEAGLCAGAGDPFSNSCGIPWIGWESAQTPLANGNDSSGVFSLAFRDQRHGIAVGGDYRRPAESAGTAAYTADGGEHWSAADKPPHGYRSAVAWDEKDGAWITVGSNGSDISYDDGKTWQWLDSGNWNALSLPWAVGPNGQIGKLGMLPPHPAKVSR
jgi:photosystem II stability/assembly factor-like uncharacterized protein